MTKSTDNTTCNSNLPLSDLYAAAIAPVRGQPLPQLPRTLYAYVRRTSARQQVVLCVLTVLVFPLTLAPLELQRRIVDDAIGGSDTRLLAILAGVYLVAIIALAGLKYVRNIYATRIAEGIASILRRRFTRDSERDSNANDGTRQSILVTESEKIGGFVSESIAFPLLQAGIIVSVSGYMLTVDPLVAVAALLFLIPAVAVVMVTQPALNRLSESKIAETRALSEDSLDRGAEDIDAGGKKAGQTGSNGGIDAERHIDRIYLLRLRFAAIKFLAKGINNTLNHLGPLSVLAVGGWFVIQGQTEVGTVVAFMSGYERMTGPVRDLLNFYRRLAMMRVQYRLVYDAGQGNGEMASF